MTTRRSEWLASIKPILDRDEAKKDAAALAKELGDILEVKVDASPENLDELAKEFNAQLKTMGKQPIVFSEKTLRGIVSQFTKAIAEGISKGVANVDFGAQLEELNKKREKILKAQNRANQAMKARTRMERLEGFNINTAELMPIDGDVAKEAQELVDILYDSAKKIDQAAEKYGKSSSHYTSAVIEAQEAYNKYLRMQKTLGTMPPSKLSTIPKDVRALYDKLGPDREKYEVGGGVNIPFEETFEAEKILDSFEELSDAFEGLVDNAGKFDKMLKQIDAKIEEITRKARESGGVDDGILRGAKDGLKTLNEIEAAYKRLKVDKGTKLRQQNESHIKSALDFDPSKNSVGIKTFAKDYYNAAASGDWAEEYHALLRYVKLYESYLTSTNKTHQNKVTAKNNPFTPLYEQLKPMAENARNMLQNILNMGEGKPLVGMGSAEGGMGAGPTNEDVANAQKIREEAEAKVRAEREALELARQRREEEEKAAKAAEQKRKAGEAAIEINKRVTEEAEKEKLAKDAILNSLRQIVDFSAKQSMEYMSLIGSDAATDVVGGADYTVDTDTLIEQLIDNLKNNILVSLHNHPDDMLAFTPSDITSYGGLYKTQGIDIHGIIANGVIQTVDFAGISKEVILQIAQSFSNHLSEAAQNSDGLFNYTDGKLTVSDDVQALADKSPGAYNQIQEELRLIINNALSRAFTDNKLQPTIKTFDGEHLPQLAEYLLQAGQNARDAIEPVEKLNQLMVIRESMSAGKVQDEAVKHQQNTAAIKEEVDAEKRLNEAKGQIVDADDDFENIAKENGALADKLELLRDIAEQYGNNISQKQRDRYEDLNQKDMNEGLTPKEDERYWELGEQIDEADQALEEFGNTYDRIIVKLENGKKIEILPDDKGLRTLAKIDEEYGESYNGVTIEDVYFERVKQEALATEQAVDGLNESLEKTQQLTSGDGVGSSTGDASSADVEAAQAEAEKQRLEKERLEAEKLALQNELYMSEERVKSAQDSEAQAYERVNDLTSELQEQRDEIYHLEQRLAEAHEVDNDALWTAEQRANEAEERANQLERKLAESFDGDKKQGSVNTEELKTLLNSIVYNVKIAHDDNDKTANKIALDDSTLEGTLTKVFANILKPQIQQNELDDVDRIFNILAQISNQIIDVAQDETVRNLVSKHQNKNENDGGKSADINPHYVTDPQGNVVEMYRGIHGAYGGLVSDRYHGGTFFTDNIELAKEYADELGKVEKVLLSMKNPLEIDGHGAQWNDIEYIGRGADDVSRRLHELHNEMRAFVECVNDVGDIVLQNAFTGEVISTNFEPEPGHEYDAERFNDLNREIQAIYSDRTNPYGVYDTNQLSEFAQNNGYDGVIFKNIIDSFSGDVQKISNVMVTFAQDQIHYIETMNARSAEWKNVLSRAGDFNKYINMTTDDVESFVMQLSTMREHFLDEAFTGSENPEDTYSRLKGEFIDPDPVFRSLYDAMFSLDDLPDDYLKVPGFIGNPSFNENDMFVDASNFITDIREALQKEQGGAGADSTGKSFALESTLQTVKGVLDSIQTNTSKIGTVKTSNVDTIAGTAIDGRLAEIKTVLESIDNKIAKGGVIATRGAVKQANTQFVEPESKSQAARSNMMKSLINDYKTMGKLAAQFANDGNLETQAMLENLKEEIARKRQSLKLTMDENKNLREKYSIAFDAEKRLLDAEKAQKEINAQTKADAKEAETAWKKQVKDAQRATGINAATTAANAGDQTVMRAIGTEGVSKDIENKAKELSDHIKTLRMLRDEIDKKGEQASDGDRDNLSKQIAKVKALKTEVDSYLKIHEKYSGEGVTDLGDASNFGAVGTDQYWNSITAEIQQASGSRVIIKGMNTDTGELTGTTKIAANTFAEWSATVDPMTGKLSMVRTGIKKTETLMEAIARKTKEVFTYFSGSSIIFKAFNELKKGIQYIREIDTALTELRKVTNETEETYDKFLKTAAKTGAKLGTTISAVTEATATFAKLGYSMEMATEMAEAAIVYKNVGDNIASTGDAADSIISTLKGFGMEASEAMAIVDKFNEVGNNFAITSQGIGEALRLSASALNEGKNSLDESIALITAANEVVNDPSSVGKQSLPTIKVAI